MKKKLLLNKETIRNLTSDELKGVAAAGTGTDTTVQLCDLTCGTCTTLFTCVTCDPLCLTNDGCETWVKTCACGTKEC
jgi:hypothetical protein